MPALLQRLIFALVLLTTPALADETFDYNAEGLELSRVKGRTLVGITRDSSKTWGVYLSKDKKAYFNFSSGKTGQGTWRQRSRNIICFKGLDKNNPSSEICKYAKPRGRGMDWMTVKVNERNGEIFYDKVTEDEHRGSSQIVYAFEGRQVPNPNSYVSDLKKWPGHLVVGRTLKDKEAWFAALELDGSVDFVFGSGKRLKGRYQIKDGQICFEFPQQETANSCRRPKVENKKILWKNASGGKAISEVVFMQKMDSDGPRKVQTIASDSHHMLTVHNASSTLAAVNRTGKGSVVLYDLPSMIKLGEIPGFARDITFNPNGQKLVASYKQSVWQIDTYTGGIDWTYSTDAHDMTEVAYATDGKRVVAGASDGTLTLLSAEDGSVLGMSQPTEALITDVLVAPASVIADNANAGDVIIALSKTGEMITTGFDDPEAANITKISDEPLYLGRYVPQKNAVLISDKAGILREFVYSDGQMTPLEYSSFDLNVGDVYGFAVHPTGRELFAAGRNGARTFDLSSNNEITHPRSKDTPWLSSSQYMPNGAGIIGKLYKNDKPKGIELWARSLAEKSRLSKATMQERRDANLRRTHIQEAQAKVQRAYAALKRESAKLFTQGDCAAYAEMQPQLNAADRGTQQACEAEAVRRNALSQYRAAVRELRCDDAQALRSKHSVGSEARENKCRETVLFNQQKVDFAAAKTARNCAKVAELQTIFGESDAAAQCSFEAALESESARKMFFAAVKFDSAKDRPRAKQLYTTIMDRFPEDDLAIQAASRLTTINDLEIMEQTQAENEAALKAAQQAVEKANADKARAQSEARKAAEQSRKDAAAARRAAEAANERARAAEQRAQQAQRQQQQRNTACDHVYVGKEFEARGGVLALTQRYIVMGVSHRAGLATIRGKHSDYRQEVSCYDIP